MTIASPASAEAAPRPQPTPRETHAGPGPTKPRPARLASVDVLRGLVMILMALDHVRNYFSNVAYDPLDLSQTTVPLYFTRWITHFCAPVFILLAGMGAWLAGRKRSPRELSVFLASRGVWLVVLEFTLVGFGWYLNFDYELGFMGQVLWAIGVSMLTLAFLVRLPRSVVAAVAVGLIAGHNLADGVALDGALGHLWTVLHVPGAIAPLRLVVVYPLIPWIGVMALGHVLAPWLVLPSGSRRARLIGLGLAMTAAFVVLRVWSGYGDPQAWVRSGSVSQDLLAFLNVTKYPPSLAYLLVTLGPALMLLAWCERWRGPLASAVATFGKVALFYYVMHVYLIHGLAILAGVATGFPAAAMRRLFLSLPEPYGFGLPMVYGMWLAVIAMLYPVCRGYAECKRRGTGWWWSYG